MANEKVQNNRRPMGGPGRGPGGRFMMPNEKPKNVKKDFVRCRFADFARFCPRSADLSTQICSQSKPAAIFPKRRPTP